MTITFMISFFSIGISQVRIGFHKAKGRLHGPLHYSYTIIWRELLVR